MATETKKKAAPKAAKKVATAKATGEKNAASVVKGLHRRKQLIGTVVSDKMQKTIVVETERKVRHTLYAKYIMKSQKFKAHDEKNEAKLGDVVSIVESRPLSKDKRWALQKIVRRAIQTVEANV